MSNGALPELPRRKRTRQGTPIGERPTTESPAYLGLAQQIQQLLTDTPENFIDEVCELIEAIVADSGHAAERVAVLRGLIPEAVATVRRLHAEPYTVVHLYIGIATIVAANMPDGKVMACDKLNGVHSALDELGITGTSRGALNELIRVALREINSQS